MAAQVTQYAQVYIRIVGARNLKGVEKDGTSDPLVTIAVNGEKTNLETKRVEKTTAPTWQQEFVVTVPHAKSTVELKVSDWNRFSSNTPLGSTVLKVEDIKHGLFQDLWLPLDTQGELHVMTLIAPFPTPLASSRMAVRLSQLRVQLENSACYPGGTLRGCVVYSLLKPKSLHGLHLMLDGRSHVHWSTGSKHKTHYYSTKIFFNAKVPLVGKTTKVAKGEQATVLQPGAYIFPFEYVLPMDLPATFESGWMGAFIRYTVTVFADVVAKADKSTQLTFRVLCNDKLMRPELVGAELTTKTGNFPVQVHVHGPLTAYVGETYSLTVKIVNNGTKAIESMTAYLRQDIWYNARISGCGNWVRRLASATPRDWAMSNLPGLPIAPGATWEGQVTVTMPPNIVTSLHSTSCPNIQVGYRIKVRLSTTGNIFTKSTGSSKYPILMADRNQAFEALPVPVEPEGPLNQICIAPAPPHVFAMLPPALTPDGKVLPFCGQYIGPVSKMPGAFIAPHVSEPNSVPGTFWVSPTSIVSENEWKPGQVPAWVTNEGMNPDLPLDPADFSVSETPPQ
jgi:hypothetical protein